MFPLMAEVSSPQEPCFIAADQSIPYLLISLVTDTELTQKMEECINSDRKGLRKILSDFRSVTKTEFSLPAIIQLAELPV